MFLKRTRSGRSSVRTSTLLHEPETIRLQKDIERLTQKLEHEKRESNYLDERIQIMVHEIGQINQKDKPSSSVVQNYSSLKSNLQLLEKKLEFEVIQLNEAKANNRKIRSVIDDYRLERLSNKRSLQCLQQDLQEYCNQAESKNIEYRRGEELDQEQKSKIIMLRCKSATEQSRYGEKIGQLTSVLQEEKQQRSKIFKMMEQEVLSNLDRPIEGIEVSRMLKKILEKWSSNTKEKKKQLDVYTKHIKVVEDAFRQIQQATGISSIEEIVTAFIKSQEQNYEIYTYMNNLNSEIDILEENLKATKNRITLVQQFKESGEKKGIEAKERVLKKCEKIEKKIEKKKTKLGNIRAEVQSIIPIIGKLIEIFDSLPINPQLNQKFDRGWLENCSEENIMSQLGYIEEFINYILILLAYSQPFESAALKHLPLDGMGAKNFDQKVFDLKDLLEAKDLYEDKELEDVKNPLPVGELKNKAMVIFEKRKMNNEILTESVAVTSFNPK